MKRKILQIIYIAAFLIICLIPFAGMSLWSTQESTENKTLAAFPSLFVDGSLNLSYFDELSDYFEDHFAFRNELVDADAQIMSRVFNESNESTVIKGSEGWLYYSSTLDDYLGTNLMSERSLKNAAHNLAITSDYVEAQGSQLLVTVPPNKNSLYGENMPYYYSQIVSEQSNIDALSELLDVNEVSYLDLFSLFEQQSEVLYLKRDSHWNNKGALMAYNAIMDSLGYDHETYDTAIVERAETEIGDLNKMLYPVSSEPEWNYFYQYDTDYTYLTPTESVGDAWIITQNEAQEGTLLMYRDSFGNTLIPFLSNSFNTAYYSKGLPYMLGSHMSSYNPDAVVIECVERNISNFAIYPPILQSLEADIDVSSLSDAESSDTTLDFSQSENDMRYYMISGVAEESLCDTDTVFYIELEYENEVRFYEAFDKTTDDTDYGFVFYLEEQYADELISKGAKASVIAYTNGEYHLLKSITL
ncbi:MAG: hypothetical protein LUI06_05870 [Ruminococcus sp.]|nr:hypothetical protein [Ruminococcus sp.]